MVSGVSGVCVDWVWGGGGGALRLGNGCVNLIVGWCVEKTYPLGCWRSDTRSSTAVDDAIEARPGRVTVHIWSSVRSERDWRKENS